MESSTKWKRPVSVPFPKIWCKFTTRPKNGKTYNIRIEDATSERHKEIVEFMLKYFLRDEPLCASLKVLEYEPTVTICQRGLYDILQNNTSVIAVLDTPDPKPEIVGMQLFYVATKEYGDFPQSETEEDRPTELLSKTDQLFQQLKNNIDPFQLFEDDKYFNDWGLCVKPEYRGLDIGYHILSCLEKLAVAFGIPGSLIIFTSIQAQILGERIGFKLYNEIVYEKYKDERGNIIFPVKGTKSVKLMGMKYLS